MMKIYQFPECPFCGRVRAKVSELGLKEGENFEYVDAKPGTPGREEVEQLGGKSQVPFLVDGETTMFESGDIINYLEEKFKKE